MLQIDLAYWYIFFISFTLYPAYSWVGRGNVVLRHSVFNLSPNFQGIACWVVESKAALCLVTRANKLKYKSTIIPWVGIKPWTVTYNRIIVPSTGSRRHLISFFYLSIFLFVIVCSIIYLSYLKVKVNVLHVFISFNIGSGR